MTATLKGFPLRLKDDVELKGEGWIQHAKDARWLLAQGGIAVFYGEPGTGKTRMSYELAKRVEPRHITVHGMKKESPCRYITAQRLLEDARQHFTDNDAPSEKNVMDDFAQAAMLVIDEIDRCVATDYGQRKLKQVVDERYQKNLPTILITNLNRKDLAKLLPAPVIDRIRECGKGYHFNWPSFRGQTLA